MGIKYILKRLLAEWKSNMWLAIELLIVSVVIWIIADQLYVVNSRMNEDPGFDISNTFLVSIEELGESAPEYSAAYSSDSARSSSKREVIERLRRRPEIEVVGLSINSYPYNGSNSGTMLQHVTEDGDTLRNSMIVRSVSPDFLKVFRYRGANGETPEQLAEIFAKHPDGIMVSSNVFGADFDATVLTGREVERYEGGFAPVKIIAVLQPVKYNEYERMSDATSVVSSIGIDEEGNVQGWYNEITVRVKDGMEKDFIENLLADSESQFRVGNLYLAGVQSFDRIAKAYNLGRKQALTSKFIVMSFLLVNIFLGFLGTFWFRTRQRYSEIALMKVTGATARKVFMTQIGEGLVLLACITPVAAAIEINMAMMEINALGDYGYLEWPRMISCIAIVFGIMAFMIVCGVSIPAYRAMHVNPASALHDE